MAEAYNSIHTGSVIDQGVTYANSLATYSTEERVVGQWIDGKPIYRRCMTISSLPIAHGTLVPTGYTLSSPEFILSAVGSLVITTGSAQFFPVSSNVLRVAVSPGDGTVHIVQEITGQTYSYTGAIAVEYTKTTDQATIAVATAEELNAAYEEGVQSA